MFFSSIIFIDRMEALNLSIILLTESFIYVGVALTMDISGYSKVECAVIGQTLTIGYHRPIIVRTYYVLAHCSDSTMAYCILILTNNSGTGTLDHYTFDQYYW